MMFGEIICRMMVSLPLKQTAERKIGNAERIFTFGVSSFCNGVRLRCGGSRVLHLFEVLQGFHYVFVRFEEGRVEVLVAVKVLGEVGFHELLHLRCFGCCQSASRSILFACEVQHALIKVFTDRITVQEVVSVFISTEVVAITIHIVEAVFVNQAFF